MAYDRSGTAYPRDGGVLEEQTEGLCGNDAPTVDVRTHQLGWELRLDVAGSLQRSQVCRSQDEVLDTADQWKAAMLEKGWL